LSSWCTDSEIYSIHSIVHNNYNNFVMSTIFVSS